MTRQPYGRIAAGIGLNRRQVLAGGGGVLAAAALAGCDLLSTDPSGAESGPEGDGGEGAEEAPMLAELVEAGDLPALAERLPDEPLVVEPTDRIGTYGGEWSTALLGPSDTAWLTRTIGYDNLMRWDVDFTEPIPNVAESIETLADGQEYVIHLRPGMKWSDGEPFTADDIMFAIEDVLFNETLYPATPLWLTAEGEPATVEKVDDVTVRLHFPTPNGLFIPHLAIPQGSALTTLPRHYLEQFHPDYGNDVEALVDEGGYSDWAELFDAMALDGAWGNADLPTLRAWRITTPLDDANTRVVAERNPYYWKVDPNGRQLPYIDRVIYEVMADEEVMLTRASNGDFDMHSRHFNTLQNKPVLANNRETGDYDFFDTIVDRLNESVLMLNLTHKDEVKREIFQNKDFRIGLSHAVNRQELVDAVFQQQGEPYQVAPPPNDELYDEEMATQYTEYDVDLANEYLDRAFPDRNNDGIRLGPDGEPISFTVDVTAGQSSVHTDVIQLVSDYWREVGVNVRVNPEEYGYWMERIHSNDHDALVWGADPGFKQAMMLEPRWYTPVGFNLFMVAWRNWYDPSREGVEGEEPPEAIQRQLELYDELKQTADEGEQDDLLREIIAIAKDEFYCIGTVLQPRGYGIAKNSMQNVPNPMVESFQYPTPAPTNPEQYFIAE